MKSLDNPQDLAEIQARLQRIRIDSARRWGKMTSHQMLCHLSDSFRMVMGEREAARRDNWLSRRIVKWLALQAPMQWPHGVKTGAEADQERGGTKPIEFAQDKADSEELLRRFVATQRDFQFVPHPMFGELTDAEWMRWGYLHCDHHLRQFGV